MPQERSPALPSSEALAVENCQDLQRPKRELGLTAAAGIVIGEAIALGIFLTPASMAKALGSPMLLLAVWLGMTLMALCGALCYAELAVRFPESGGEYVYLRHGYGDTVAFIYGWMSAIVMYPGVAASLAFGGAVYIVELFQIPKSLAPFVPASLLLVFCILNIVGTRLSGTLLSFLNILKLVILFGLVVWALASGHAHAQNLMPFSIRRAGSDAIFPAVVGAVMGAFFSFGGWWEAGKIAGEVKNPQRNLPLALLGGVSIVGVVYILISGVFLATLPLESITSSAAFVAQFGAALFGAAGSRILSAAVVVCVFGGVAALMMAAPRVTYSMASSGNFLPIFGRLSRRWQTPTNAILLQTVLAIAVLLLGAFDRMLAYIIFSAILFLALTATVLFRIPGGIKKWWFPAAPIVFIALSAVIDLLILMHDPKPAIIGVIVTLLGIPVRSVLIRQRGALSPAAER
jgi:basic amino acid/polyamine antiporter, APA family